VKKGFQTLLENRMIKGGFRSLSLFEGYTDFYSNDYLGMSSCNSRVYNQSSHSGSTGSRLISGNSSEAMTCEHFLASFFHSESALVFNSGYDANLGFFSAVPQKGEIIIYDELVHASIRDGIRLSNARNFSFKHNDIEDLAHKLSLVDGQVCYVVVESLYSMDGDFAPLNKITSLLQKHDFNIIVDDAHAVGVFGEQGKGLSYFYRAFIFARIITFGKAYGAHGAAILGCEELIHFLINFSRSFIYTTALPAFQYELIVDQISKSKDASSRILLSQNISLFRTLLGQDLISGINSPIQVFQLNSDEKALLLAEKIQLNEIAVKAILPPTVPVGKATIRVCIHSFNSDTEIRKIVSLIKDEVLM